QRRRPGGRRGQTPPQGEVSMMRSKSRVLVVAVAAGVLFAWGGLTAEEDKPLSISEIMTRAHKGAGSLKNKIDKALKSGQLDGVKKDTEELVKLGKDLVRNEPPMGTAASWKKLAGAYAKNAELLDAAVAKKQQQVAS